MSDRTTVFDEQGNKLVLSPADHLATGGEGSVYVKKDWVYKVYLDPDKAIRAKLPAKVDRLKLMRHPGVASPVGCLKDKNGQFTGIVLPRVTGEALCKMFTNTWRDAHQFADKEARAVARGMREVMDFAHAHQALLVDGNELNWLVDKTNPVAIDVDSWQLPGFPATAIMASIRDPLLKTTPAGLAVFDEGTDWFAWAVVTFQLWTGIHPFKGNHPGFPRNALTQRMKAGVSVFNKDVSVPAAVRSFDQIPLALRTWYQEVFEKGLRTAPPVQWELSAQPQTAPRLKQVQLSMGSLKQERLGAVPGLVLGSFAGLLLVRTTQGLGLWSPLKKQLLAGTSSWSLEDVVRGKATVLATQEGPVFLSVEPGQGIALKTLATTAPTALLPSRAEKIWACAGRVFALVEGVSSGLVELKVDCFNQKWFLSVHRQWPVSILSTSFFDGCFVQDCLGTPFLGVPEKDGLVQLRALGLRDWRIVLAKGLDRHNVWVVGVRKSDGQLMKARLADTGLEFEIEHEEPVSQAELDAVALLSGVGVLRSDGSLLLSKGVQRKELQGVRLPDSSKLLHSEAGLTLVDSTEVSKLSFSG